MQGLRPVCYGQSANHRTEMPLTFVFGVSQLGGVLFVLFRFWVMAFFASGFCSKIHHTGRPIGSIGILFTYSVWL